MSNRRHQRLERHVFISIAQGERGEKGDPGPIGEPGMRGVPGKKVREGGHIGSLLTHRMLGGNMLV